MHYECRAARDPHYKPARHSVNQATEYTFIILYCLTEVILSPTGALLLQRARIGIAQRPRYEMTEIRNDPPSQMRTMLVNHAARRRFEVNNAVSTCAMQAGNIDV
jgi:hypothetical protein